jgi:hypothetical protein
MDLSSALLNDATQTLYNYTIQLPFLKMVMEDLDQQLTLNGNPINLISEAEIDVPLGDIALSLPAAFFLPISLMEKGDTDTKFWPMTQRADVTQLQLDQTNVLGYWDFRHNGINFIGSIVDRTVKLTYWRQLAELIDEDSLVEVASAKNMLALKTAALCAENIGGNEQRANRLEARSGIALDTLLSLGTKNNQGIRVRRRPFRIPTIRQSVRIP